MNTCPNCNKEHKNTKFCSMSCSCTYQNKLRTLNRVPRNCLRCGTEHKNPKFCSMSCAAKFNNIKYIKRKNNGELPPSKFCKNCKTEPISRKNTYCSNCWNRDMTIEESQDGRVDANKYNKLRFRARTFAKSKGLLNCCFNCGYAKHVECCHIKNISDFHKDTLLSIVNSETNLVGLCPNCHWEFDSGLIQIDKSVAGDLNPTKGGNQPQRVYKSPLNTSSTTESGR